MSGGQTGDWVRIYNGSGAEFKFPTMSTTSDTFTVSTAGTEWFVIDEYDVGTKLLRDAAHKAEAYAEKLKISRRDWPSRRELRNV